MITFTYGDKAAVELDRSKLLHLFPESLLSQALQGDPEAKEIHLENPLITGEVVQCLQGLLMGELPPIETKLPVKAGDYLNIPLFNVFSQKDYAEILDTCNYRDKKWKYHRPPYKRYIGAGRRHFQPELFQYGLRLMPEDALPEYLAFLKKKVLAKGSLGITRVMLLDSRFPIDCKDISSLMDTHERIWHQWYLHGYCTDNTSYTPSYRYTLEDMLSHMVQFDGFERVIEKLKQPRSSGFRSCFLDEPRLKAYHDQILSGNPLINQN